MTTTKFLVFRIGDVEVRESEYFTGGAAERVVDLKGFNFTSFYNGWVGLDLDDAPMVLRDVGGDDIYSLRFPSEFS